MSEFQKILKRRNLDLHTGQPIWKYAITDLEFGQLKERFKIVKRIYDLDPRTCAVYYAEWWKRNYNGGYPSKDDIYNSIGGHKLSFDADEFYELAKRGGKLLNFKWIKIQYTYYFKTLLLQGGLPLNHIKNNQGKYRDFLLKIIHKNPQSIEDFSSDNELTSLLSKSSRNEIIYACCLEIVRAVLDNNLTIISELQQNNELRQLTEDLIIERDKVKTKGNTLKFKWHFDAMNKSFFLNTTINTRIDADNLTYILGDPNLELANEYKLFIGNALICKFMKKKNGNFKIVQLINSIKFSDDLAPEIYFTDDVDCIYTAEHLIHTNLSLSTPSLWLQTNDDIYILEKSRYTKNNTAYALVDETFTIEGDIEEKIQIQLNGNTSCFFVKFKNYIHFIKGYSSSIRFKTNIENVFEWTILSEKPKWLIRSSIPVIKNIRKILVYDKSGNRITHPEIKWKLRNKSEWNSSYITLEKGLLDIKISHDGIEEFDSVFNIGDFNIEINSNQSTSQYIISNNNYKLEIYRSELYDFSVLGNKINFELVNPTKLPPSIKARLTSANQSAGVIIELTSAFQGVGIVDQFHQIIEDEILYLDKIKGWRLVSNSCDKEFEIKLSNNKNPEISIVKSINRRVTPLVEYIDDLKTLFQLFNIIDDENFVKVSVAEISPNGKSKKIRHFSIKQFSKTIEWNISNQNEIFFSNIEDIDIVNSVFALPIDCQLDDIDKIEIRKQNEYFFLEKYNIEKFILFSDKNAKYKIKPEFISTNPNNESTSVEDRNLRITNFAKELIEADFSNEIWSKFWVYYYLCKENDLPFATFDLIKAITTSSIVAAKAFVFLALKFDANEFKFSSNDFIELQNDLGFSFHWVKLSDWEDITNSYPELFEAVVTMLEIQGNNLKLCLLNNKSNSNFAFLAELNNVRERLGERVLNQLPAYNIVEDRNKYIKQLPQQKWNDQVNILVVAPLTVASSIRGVETGLWHINGDNFRRKIKYVEDLDKTWYEESLIYYLN